MRRKAVLVVSAALVAGAWAICGLVYANDGGGAYNGAVFGFLIFVAAAFTVGGAVAIVGAGRPAGLSLLVPMLLSTLAALSILLLAVAINSRG